MAQLENTQGQTVYGIHAVTAALKENAQGSGDLFIHDARHKEKIRHICELAAAMGKTIHTISKAELQQRLGAVNHQGVMLVLRSTPHWQESDLDSLLEQSQQVPLMLALDSVQDPHNLGACLRSADALGVLAVIVPKDRACDLTPVVRKVACGGAERVPLIRVTNLVRTLTRLQQHGLWVVGMAGEAEQAIGGVDLTLPSVIVMGAEGKGLRVRTRKACDYLAAIPLLGTVGSLNVSVACGVVLYEVYRQRWPSMGTVR